MKRHKEIRNELKRLRGAVAACLTEADYIKLNEAIKDVYDFCMSCDDVYKKLNLYYSMTIAVGYYKAGNPDWYAKYVLTEDISAMIQKLDQLAKVWEVE